MISATTLRRTLRGALGIGALAAALLVPTSAMAVQSAQGIGSYDFGTIWSGTKATKTFTFKRSGSGEKVSGFVNSGTSFTVLENTCTTGFAFTTNATTCAVKVEFTAPTPTTSTGPEAAGAIKVLSSFQNNIIVNYDHEIHLHGTASGAQGTPGQPGLPGDRGPVGCKVTVVTPVEQEPGVPGEDGPQGPQGPTENVDEAPNPNEGEPGGDDPLPVDDTPECPKGDKGDQGDPGTDGTDGAKGDTGATGTAGAAGAKGDAGPTGATGAQGTPGAAGPAGVEAPQSAALVVTKVVNVRSSCYTRRNAAKRRVATCRVWLPKGTPRTTLTMYAGGSRIATVKLKAGTRELTVSQVIPKAIKGWVSIKVTKG